MSDVRSYFSSPNPVRTLFFTTGDHPYAYTSAVLRFLLLMTKLSFHICKSQKGIQDTAARIFYTMT